MGRTALSHLALLFFPYLGCHLPTHSNGWPACAIRCPRSSWADAERSEKTQQKKGGGGGGKKVTSLKDGKRWKSSGRKRQDFAEFMLDTRVGHWGCHAWYTCVFTCVWTGRVQKWIQTLGCVWVFLWLWMACGWLSFSLSLSLEQAQNHCFLNNGCVCVCVRVTTPFSPA